MLEEVTGYVHTSVSLILLFAAACNFHAVTVADVEYRGVEPSCFFFAVVEMQLHASDHCLTRMIKPVQHINIEGGLVSKYIHSLESDVRKVWYPRGLIHFSASSSSLCDLLSCSQQTTCG